MRKKERADKSSGIRIRLLLNITRKINRLFNRNRHEINLFRCLTFIIQNSIVVPFNWINGWILFIRYSLRVFRYRKTFLRQVSVLAFFKVLRGAPYYSVGCQTSHRNRISDDDQVDPNKACRIAMAGLRNTSFCNGVYCLIIRILFFSVFWYPVLKHFFSFRYGNGLAVWWAGFC